MAFAAGRKSLTIISAPSERLPQREAMAKCCDSTAPDRCWHVGAGQRTPPIERLQTQLPALRAALAAHHSKYVGQPLKTMLMPHNIVRGCACFAHFNKIWGIPPIQKGLTDE
jgi:hypothetical protein